MCYAAVFLFTHVEFFMGSSTPDNVQLHLREFDFDFTAQPFPWLGTVHQCHFFHALSVFIPTLERYVSTNIQQQLNDISDNTLHEQGRTFVQQELRHAYVHNQCNDVLFKQYPALKKLQSWYGSLLGWIDRLASRAFSASIPACFEHFTANISRDVLTNPEKWTKGLNNDAVRFLHWHCLEELEHQAVCFDVYHHTYRQPKRLWFYLFFLWVPLTTVGIFSVQAYLLFKDKQLKKPKQWWKFLVFCKQSSRLFYAGISKYLREDMTLWTEQDLELYLKNTHSQPIRNSANTNRKHG